MTEEKRTRYEELARKHGDPWIWGIYLFLVAVSIVASYSASSREIAQQGIWSPLLKQCAFLAIGFGIVLVVHRWNYNKSSFLITMIPLFGIVTLGMLIYVTLFGTTLNGATRQFSLFGFSVQPAELAKLSIVTLLSFILARSQHKRDISWRGTILAGAAVGLYCGLLFLNGLTNTILLMVVSVSMLIIGGISGRKLCVLLVSYVLMGGTFYLIKSSNDDKRAVMDQVQKELAENGTYDKDTQATNASIAVTAAKDDKPARSQLRDNTWRNRIKDYFTPLLDQPITTKNAQQMYSRIAQAHGGIKGVGPGNSRECSRLPLAFSDYIYSIIVEEFGLWGGLLLLVCYLWLLARAAMIVQRTSRALPSLLVIGMAALITYQALFHMAINVGVFPVSGQPLPLISKGGSATLVMSLAFGIMLSVSRTVASNKNNPSGAEILPKGLDAVNPTQIQPRHVWK